MELLSPAGSPEKLRTAIRYGADAVYFAGKSFGMRAAASNFTTEEIYESVRYAHSCNVKAYLTLNTITHENQFGALEEFLHQIKDFNIDAFIISDMGVASAVKEIIPTAQLHLSTQCSAASSRACIEYAKMGFSRIVLARELSLEQIKSIRKNIPDDIELEAFVHGSMCIAYSGRCLLSNFFIGRDANQGACAQPCRWNYSAFGIREEKRPDMFLNVIEDSLGSYIMASKDMCMIEHIPELAESGIDCLKIEGRMKSAYYTAVVTNTYKMALNRYFADKDGYVFDNEWQNELDSVSHREYDTGFFFTSPSVDAKTVTDNGYIREKSYLATVVEYDKDTKRATFYQKNKLVENQAVEILSPGITGRQFTVTDMRDCEGNPITEAPHPKMLFSMPVPFELEAGDILRGY